MLECRRSGDGTSKLEYALPHFSEICIGLH